MLKLLLWTWLFVALPALAQNPGGTGGSAASRSGLGINLQAPRYWQSDFPFLNEFKRAGGWFTACNDWSPQCRDFKGGASSQNTREQAKLDLDANGWVRSLPAADDPTVKFRSVGALLFQGDEGAHLSGRYVVLYEGQGTIEYAGLGKKIAAESRPGRDVVDVSNGRNAGWVIRITKITEGNHIRNIRIVPPGGVCADAPSAYVVDERKCGPGANFRSMEQLLATQVFHPAFLADMRGFRVIRFVHWASANESDVVGWDERAKPQDALWSSRKGVPLEVMLGLTTAVDADPWINVPSYVDDDYIRQMARLLKQSVKAPRTIYLEYGNEPWNSAYPYVVAGKWYEKNARAKWPEAKVNDLQLRVNWYALRSIQVCRLVKAEFGEQAERVHCIANGMAANAVVSDWTLACDLAKSEIGHACGREFDALAIAPYFGHYLGHPNHAELLQRWTQESDGGLDQLFRELNGRDTQGRSLAPPLFASTGKGPATGAIEQAREWIAANKNLAEKYKLPLIAYEGGQHLMTDKGGKVDALFRAANRDRRMGVALTRNLQDWKASGGELFVMFTYTVKSGRFGYFGLKEDQFDDDSPKWQAVKALRQQPCWWDGCAR
jgi:hypothetical protein